MSYDKNIEGYVIKFREEDDYLQCRIQFLQRERMDIFAPTFLEFIQHWMYDEKCVVESIADVGSWISTWSGNSSIGNDNYTEQVLGTFTTHENIAAGQLVIGQPNANNDVYLNGAISNVTVSNSITSFIDTSTMEISSGFYFDSNSGEVNFVEHSLVVPPAQPASMPPKEEKKEEPPEDPIENRWAILDL